MQWIFKKISFFKIRVGEIKLNDAKENQNDLKSDLSEIK